MLELIVCFEGVVAVVAVVAVMRLSVAGEVRLKIKQTITKDVSGLTLPENRGRSQTLLPFI